MRLIRAWPLLPSVFLALASGDALCRDPNPPEVQALIGMKIPPQVMTVRVADRQTGRMQDREQTGVGDIPGFITVGSGGLNASIGPYSLDFELGTIHKTAAFVIYRSSNDLTRVIIDARALPAELLDWRIIDGQPVGNSGAYQFSTLCAFKDKTENERQYASILGLVAPEKDKTDCAHDSGHVKEAWGIDRESGRIEDISPKGLKCHYLTMNDCQ